MKNITKGVLKKIVLEDILCNPTKFLRWESHNQNIRIQNLLLNIQY